MDDELQYLIALYQAEAAEHVAAIEQARVALLELGGVDPARGSGADRPTPGRSRRPSRGADRRG